MRDRESVNVTRSLGRATHLVLLTHPNNSKQKAYARHNIPLDNSRYNEYIHSRKKE
jgi:hypothetical protein